MNSGENVFVSKAIKNGAGIEETGQLYYKVLNGN